MAIVAILLVAGAVFAAVQWWQSRAETAPSAPPPSLAGAKEKKKRRSTSAPAGPEAGTAPGKPPAPSAGSSAPKSTADFKTGGITFEKASGSSLVYAVGLLTNASSHQRFEVRVEVALSDAAGQSAGLARDMRSTLEPGEVWRFRALILDSRAKSGVVAAISEAP